MTDLIERLVAIVGPSHVLTVESAIGDYSHDEALNFPPITPLAVVLNELLQNAVDHAFPEGHPGGEVRVEVSTTADRLDVQVVDNGVGLPEGFEFDKATGLGLSIVRALVVSDLAGTISAGDSAGAGLGTAVSLSVPLHLR